MRYLILVLAVFGISIADEARAASLCDGLRPNNLRAAHFERWQNDAIRMLPVIYAARARQVAFVLKPQSDDLFMPIVRKNEVATGKPYRVIIPYELPQMVCNMIQVEFLLLMSGEQKGDRATTELALRNCVDRRKSVPLCVWGVYYEAGELIEERGLWLPETRTALLQATDQAVRSILLHELGHVMLGHLEHPSLTQEDEADRFAMVLSSLRGTQSFATQSVYAALSIADIYFPSDSANMLHQISTCRAVAIFEFGREFGDELRRIFSHIHRRRGSGELPLEFLFLNEATPALKLQPGLQARFEKSTCRKGSQAAISPIRADLGAIIGVIDLFERADPLAVSRLPEDYWLAPFSSLSLQSSAGRYIRNRLFFIRTRDYIDGLPANQPPPAFARQLLDRVLNSPEHQLMASADYGELLGMKVTAFRDPPPLSLSEDAGLRLLGDRLNQALFYNDRFAASIVLRVTVSFAQGECQSAGVWLKRGLSLPTAEVAPVLAERLRQFSKLAETNDCAAMRSIARPLIAENYFAQMTAN